MLLRMLVLLAWRTCREQLTYQVSAIAASVGVTGLAILATYLRFDWHLMDEGEMPWGELLGTLTLVAGGVVSAPGQGGRRHRRRGAGAADGPCGRSSSAAAIVWLVPHAQFGMEMYARFAHKTLWHDFAPGWALHKSHHEPRTGPFEANDIFALINGERRCE